MINNYRVDVFFRGQHYKIEFPEYWLAKEAAKAYANDKEARVFLLIKDSIGGFDVNECWNVD